MNTIAAGSPVKFINEVEAAELLGVSRAWLQRRRLDGTGPPWLRVGDRVVRYEAPAVLNWARETFAVGSRPSSR